MDINTLMMSKGKQYITMEMILQFRAESVLVTTSDLRMRTISLMVGVNSK